MLRYIPNFILERFARQETKGCLQGYALLFDIADFTPISAEMQKMGKQGAEELSGFLDYVFEEPIRIVESWGGFVSLLVGDAFCAVFPDEGAFEDAERAGNKQRVLAAVQEIARYFEDKDTYHCPIGDFALKIRQTVAYGEIGWQIYENELQNEYVFFGQPLKELAELSALKLEVVFSDGAAEQTGIDYFVPFAEKALIPKGEAIIKPPDLRKHPIPAQDAMLRFINPKYQESDPQAELRSAAFCFANLEGIAIEHRAQAVSELQNMANSYGGFINKYDATDKGLTALILFGLPRSEERTLERICSFALEAVERLPQLALGISCGTVIACQAGSGAAREYTALGAPVNLASRLMSKASAGEVLSDTYLWEESHQLFDFSYLGTVSLKGIEKSIGYYRLRELAKTRNRAESPFVGREAEIARLRNIIDKSLHNKENVIVYLCGDAGIGKSRLAAEAMIPYGISSAEPSKNCYKYFLSCDLVLKKSLEVIKQLVRAHFYFNPLLPAEAGIAMFRALWSAIDSSDPEMQRIESFIASLLDYHWEGSIWSMLPPEEKPNQLKQAFVYLIGKLTAQKPILIYLDDAQWIDDESASYLQALSDAEPKPVIIVSPCRYLENGAKPELGLKHHQRTDLDLNSLSESGSSELIKSILRLDEIPPATDELIQSRSMGNPLFIEQLSHYLLETGSLNDKAEIIKELGYLSTFSISDIVSSRIDRLTQKVKECLYGASVLGMEFDVRILSEMLKTELSGELESGKENLIWKELREIRYIFSHILIKDVAYQSMLSGKLKKLHLLAAEAMEELFADKLDEHAEEIALHYDQAGMEVKAAEYYDSAGGWYRKAYRFENSYINLYKALEIREKALGAEHPDTASTVNSMARLYENQGKYAEAEPLYQRALSIRENSLGAEHPDTAKSLNNLALLYKEQGKYDKSEPLYLRALVIKEKALGQESQEVASSMNNLANLYNDQGRYTEAEPLYLRVLAIQEKVLGAEHPDAATSLNNLANLYNDQGKYAEAENLFLRALAIRENIFGAEHPETANSLNNLAALYFNQGKYAEAEPLYQKVLAFFEKVFGAEHPHTATSLSNLATLLTRQGKYAEAEPLYLKALTIVEGVLGAEHPNTSIALNCLACLYYNQGKYAKAEPMMLQVLLIHEKVLGKDHPVTAVTLNNLASLYKEQGRYAEAEPLHQRALAIKEQALGAEHPDTANSLNNLATLYDNQGKYAEAEPLYLRALRIKEKALGTEHPSTATSLNNLATMYQKQGRYAEAESLYLSALAIREKVLGAEHPNTATSLNNLGKLLAKQGKYAEAEPVCQRALAIYEKVLDTGHPDTALPLNSLGNIYKDTGEYQKAEEMLLKALEIWQSSQGLNHPWTIEALNSIIELYKMMNLPDKAAHYQSMLPKKDPAPE